MKKLISIYVSLFLVFSLLQAQSKGRAKLYTRTGRLVEGTIVKIEENSIIFAELLKNGKLRKQKVPNSMIYKLISPLGEVLIENVAFESEFKSNVELFPERIQELLVPEEIKDYERKEPDQISIVSWHITTSNGDKLEAFEVQIINDDSLRIASNGFEQYIAIGSIKDIIIKRKMTVLKFIKGVGKGLIIGVSVGVVYGILVSTVDSGLIVETNPFVLALVGGSIGGFFGIIGGVVVTSLKSIVLGSDKKIKLDKMSKWEKLNLIQDLLISVPKKDNIQEMIDR